MASAQDEAFALVACRRGLLTPDAVARTVAAIVKELDFLAKTYDENFEVNGTAPGVGCHSGPAQGDCPDVFDAFGLSIDTGAADASKNVVFGKGAM